MEQHILTLIFVTLGVFIIPFLVPLIGLPVAVGELLYGIALYYLFNSFHLATEAIPIIDFLAFLGFSLLMFLAGLEIDWNKLETLNKKEKFVITAVVVSNFVFAFLAVELLQLPIEMVLLLGSLGIGLMLSVVRELDIPPKVVQLVLITGSLGEVTTLLGLTFYDLYLSFGFSKSFLLHIGWVALFGLFFMFLLKLLKLLIWYFPEKVAALIESENKAAIDIRAIFALMLTFMAFTSLIHIEPILGAFIAGILFGFIFREKEAIEYKLSAFGYGFLIPFFFIQVGFSFDLHCLGNFEMVKTAFILLISLFMVKFLSSFWFTFTEFSLKDILLTSLLFSFPFTILIAVAKILHEKGIWNSFYLSVVILLTIISAIVFPYFARLLVKTK